MWPALRPGDLAGFAPLEGEPRPGRVVVARVGERLLVHRVVASGEEILLRGDNCALTDPPVERSQVLGEVRLVRRSRRLLRESRWDSQAHRLAGKLTLQARRVLRRLRWS
jgi:hypothetical protein